MGNGVISIFSIRCKQLYSSVSLNLTNSMFYLHLVCSLFFLLSSVPQSFTNCKTVDDTHFNTIIEFQYNEEKKKNGKRRNYVISLRTVRYSVMYFFISFNMFVGKLNIVLTLINIRNVFLFCVAYLVISFDGQPFLVILLIDLQTHDHAHRASCLCRIYVLPNFWLMPCVNMNRICIVHVQMCPLSFNHPGSFFIHE